MRRLFFAFRFYKIYLISFVVPPVHGTAYDAPLTPSRLGNGCPSHFPPLNTFLVSAQCLHRCRLCAFGNSTLLPVKFLDLLQSQIPQFHDLPNSHPSYKIMALRLTSLCTKLRMQNPFLKRQSFLKCIQSQSHDNMAFEMVCYSIVIHYSWFLYIASPHLNRDNFTDKNYYTWIIMNENMQLTQMHHT